MAQQCFIKPSALIEPVDFRSCLGHSKGTMQPLLEGRDKTQGRGCPCSGEAGKGQVEKEGEGKGGEIKGGGGRVVEGCFLHLISH